MRKCAIALRMLTYMYYAALSYSAGRIQVANCFDGIIDLPRGLETQTRGQSTCPDMRDHRSNACLAELGALRIGGEELAFVKM